ncbi:MAG TPA: hypothetical protein VME19_06860, partial [Streptosporangiaceae bacterium]|nr:hypothetical protein [Streptosporangiaceae bacterium]
MSKAWALPLPDEGAPPVEEDTGVPSPERAHPVGQPCAEGGTGPGHHYGTGWIWGDAEGAIPADAPLHLLMLAASRVMTAYYVASLAQAGVQVSPAGLGVLRILLAGDGLKSSD